MLPAQVCNPNLDSAGASSGHHAGACYSKVLSGRRVTAGLIRTSRGPMTETRICLREIEIRDSLAYALGEVLTSELVGSGEPIPRAERIHAHS